MRKTLGQLIFLPAIMLFGSFATGQNLTPKELVQINNSPDVMISNMLADKGFKNRYINDFDQNLKETRSLWYFQFFNLPGEHVSSNVLKSVDTIQGTKTIFLLYNPFHYKEFVQNLVKSKYRFTEIQVIYSKAYTVFENKGTVFMTRESQEPDGKPVFTIIVKAK